MKRIIAIICALSMFLMVACSSVKPADIPADNSSSKETVAEETNGSEPVNIVWWTCDYDYKLADLEKVLAKANEISAEKIGVTADIIFKNESQLDLDFNTGEYYDVMFSCSWLMNFDQLARSGKFYDITDIVKEKTPALYEAVDPWWDPATVDGRIYGIPELKDLGAEVFFILNQDYYEEEKGMTIPDEFDFADIEEYLQVYKEDHPNEYPLYLKNTGPQGLYQVHERIVNNYLVIPYRYAGTDRGTTIIPVWEDDEFMDMLRTMHRWYELGYINPDAATNLDGIKDGTPVRTVSAWTGFRCGGKTQYGHDTKMVRYAGPNMSRATMQGANVGINAAADEEHVTAVLKYFELLYTDKEFRDLLAYGIEGEHFNYYKDTVIKTEAGIQNYNFDYYCTGPAISVTPRSTSEDELADPDMWQKVYEGYKDATISDTNGFSFDDTTVSAECTAMAEYMSNYWYELVTGTVDPDVKMQEIKTQMEKIGFEKVRAEAQRQLDEYLNTMK